MTVLKVKLKMETANSRILQISILSFSCAAYEVMRMLICVQAHKV